MEVKGAAFRQQIARAGARQAEYRVGVRYVGSSAVCVLCSTLQCLDTAAPRWAKGLRRSAIEPLAVRVEKYRIGHGHFDRLIRHRRVQNFSLAGAATLNHCHGNRAAKIGAVIT